MINYFLIIPILASFMVTLLSLPNWIRRAKNVGLTGRDIQKIKKEEVAESGGVMVIAGFALGVLSYVALKTFVLKDTEGLIEIFALLTTIILISYIAFTDDILGWKIGLKKSTRLALVVLASVPLMAINAGESLISLPFLGEINLGVIYPLILIPLGIVGATTTYNFLAGYNGLEAGQGILILSAVSAVAFFTGHAWLSIIVLCMVVSLIAFLIYNMNPAKVFPGDSLTYSVGGLIAVAAILGNFEKIAVFFFIPYIIETGLKFRGNLNKESFSKVDKNGNLSLMYEKIYSLTHLSVYLWNMTRYKATENKVIFSIWIFQIILIILGFIIFRNGIFG